MTLQKFTLALLFTFSLLLSACGVEEGQSSEPVHADYPTDPDTGERLCAGIAGFPCGEGEYCQFTEGTCHIIDNMGICQPIPEVCTMDFRPVCGCDGKTYSNACAAAASGVSVSHEGMCGEE